MVYVGSLDASLYAVTPGGSLAWSFATGDALYSSAAIGSDGTIYLGGYDHKLYAIGP
jgi:outer membrane protein assembly factor BamB